MILHLLWAKFGCYCQRPGQTGPGLKLLITIDSPIRCSELCPSIEGLRLPHKPIDQFRIGASRREIDGRRTWRELHLQGRDFASAKAMAYCYRKGLMCCHVVSSYPSYLSSSPFPIPKCSSVCIIYHLGATCWIPICLL